MTFDEWKADLARAAWTSIEENQPEPVTRCKHGRGDCDDWAHGSVLDDRETDEERGHDRNDPGSKDADYEGGGAES